MSTILLPIKPKYVELIFNRSKRYEFRKRVPKDKIDKVIVYSTSPVMKVVGELIIEDILCDDKEIIWNITKEYTGVPKDRFDNYFKSVDKACAYKIKDVIIYDKEKDLKDIGINYVPQSYVYLER